MAKKRRRPGDESAKSMEDLLRGHMQSLRGETGPGTPLDQAQAILLFAYQVADP